MASSPASKVLTSFDPLTPPAREPTTSRPAAASASTNPNSFPSAPATPTSFKRRTASKSNLKSTTGLLTGILSRSPDPKTDFLPAATPAPGGSNANTNSLATPRGREPSSMSSYSNAVGSDDDGGDESEGEGEGVGRLAGPGAGPGGTRISFSGNMAKPRRLGADAGAFLSPGGSAFASLRGGRRISRNFVDDDPDRDAPSLRPLSPGQTDDPAEDGLVPEPTPLPTMSMLVLCICMFGEFLSASLSSPFLYFMIEDMGVGQGPNGGGEAAVGAYCGVVSSMFFLSQFLTSLLWVSVANKHGRRVVLFSSLLGNGLSLMAFGTSKNLKSAIATRLAMGLFNGAVGVARSAVGDLTDSSNSGRAYTYMGLSWGLGGIVGSVIGGLTENPVRNYPYLFGDSILFAEYPYLLPCLIAGSVTLIGALLSLFLGPDGGPREGAIRLPNEKDVERAAGTFSTLARFIASQFTALWYRTKGQGPVALDTASGTPPPLPSPLPSPALDEAARLTERNPLASRRASNKYGSAFGPGQAGPGSAFSRAGTSGYDPISMRIPSMRRRSQYRTASVMTGATSTRYAPDFEAGEAPASFAERFLLSNNNRTFNLAELWVSGKTREADDNAYAQSEYEASVFDPTTATEADAPDESRFSLDEDHAGEPDFRGYGSVVPSLQDLRAEARRQDQASESTAAGHSAGPSTDTVQPLESGFDRVSSRDRTQRIFSGASVGGRPGGRRLSMASSFRGQSIFSNTGLDPHTLAQAMAAGPRTPLVEAPNGNEGLLGIPEGRPASIIDLEAGEDAIAEPSMSELIWQLPLGVIAQYGLVALHGTSCDQVFLSFLVTPISSGGLGLKASDYAGLVALMFFFQMVWQFKFYPNVGPPNGPFSHLAMFRIGLCLYLPVYLLFPQLRGLLPKNGSGEKAYVLFGMALLSSMRYLASCCSYTAVMVLVNALSPPDLIPLANGIGQTTVSFARFIGPLIGGAIWAESISGDVPEPSAGFVVIAGMCLAGLVLSMRIK